MPWLVVENFNEIAYAYEKGGRLRRGHQLEEFRYTLTDCALHDLGFSEPWFTWQRGHLYTMDIREHLDHCVTNNSWSEQFLTSWVQHAPHSVSNHYPLVVTVLSTFNISSIGGSRDVFRFVSRWVSEPTCEAKI